MQPHTAAMVTNRPTANTDRATICERLGTQVWGAVCPTYGLWETAYASEIRSVILRHYRMITNNK